MSRNINKKRQEEILLSLKKCDYLSRSQLQKMHDLKSDRNAQRVLRNMENYLSSFFDGEKVFYLNKNGREQVGCSVVRKKTQNVRHFLIRNDYFIHVGCPDTWKNEIKITHEPSNVTVVCDAVYSKNGRDYLVEIDHLQAMAKNRRKVHKYRCLFESGAFRRPTYLIWITTTEYRRRLLLDLCHGLNVRVFLDCEIK